MRSGLEYGDLVNKRQALERNNNSSRYEWGQEDQFGDEVSIWSRGPPRSADVANLERLPRTKQASCLPVLDPYV